MTGDAMHDYRAKESARKLADILADRARSLAMFPVERMNEDSVTYDLLAQTVLVVLLRLTNNEPSTIHTLIDQLATEVHLLIEEEGTVRA